MSVFQAKTAVKINIGEVICLRQDGLLHPADTCLLSDVKSMVGVAVRNIEKGELVEYADRQNTKDIAARVQGVLE